LVSPQDSKWLNAKGFGILWLENFGPHREGQNPEISEISDPDSIVLTSPTISTRNFRVFGNMAKLALSYSEFYNIYWIQELNSSMVHYELQNSKV
jgi:hypothetical protein